MMEADYNIHEAGEEWEDVDRWENEGGRISSATTTERIAG